MALNGAPFSFAGYFCSAFIVFCFLALIQIADEHKDYKYDAVHHPERPVPSGVVTLRELRIAGLLLIIITAAVSLLFSAYLLIPLALALVYYILTFCSFFSKNWLHKHAGASIFLGCFISCFLDGYTVTAQWVSLLSVSGIFHLVLFTLARLFAVYALELAFKHGVYQTPGFKRARPALMFVSTAVSGVLLIIALLAIINVPAIYSITIIAFAISAVCILFSNANHRLFRFEKFGVTFFSLAVAILPCFVSRLLG